MLELLFSAIAVIGVIAAVVIIVYWILRPVNRAAKNLELPKQFTLIDFLCLFFVLQLYMALTHSFLAGTFVPRTNVVVIWVFDIYGWISFALMWADSVQKLSRAGISHSWHRATFLAFVLPVAFFCSIAVPILLFLCIYSVLFGIKNVDPIRLILFGIIAAGSVAIVLAGYFTRWMVAASRPVDRTVADWQEES